MSPEVEEASSSASTEAGPIARLWWVEGPLRMAGFMPQLASALTDGQYLMRWNKLAATSPVLAFAIGIVLELTQQREIFSTSLLLIGVLLAFGFLSVQLGCWAVVGYVAADIASGRRLRAGWGSRNWWNPLAELLSMAVEYLILAGGVILVPLLVLSLRVELRRRGTSTLIGVAGERFLQALAVVALTFVWSQSTVSSIRTVYRLVDQSIPSRAVFTVQEQWHYLAAAGVGITVLRWGLERLALRPASLAILQETVERFPVASPPSRRRVLFFQVVAALVILGGVTDSWWQVPVVVIVVVSAMRLRWALGETKTGKRMAAWSLVARTLGLAILSYAVFSIVAQAPRNSFLQRDDFMGVWTVVLAMYALSCLLTLRDEEADRPPGRRRPPGERLPPGTALGFLPWSLPLAGGAALLAGTLLHPAPALADNCSGLSDCWGTSDSFLLALGILLVVLGITLILVPGLVLATPALVTTGGMVIGASVTIPASVLTTAGIGGVIAGTGLIAATQIDDLVVLSSSTGAGRGDAHGDGGRELERIQDRIREAEAQLAELQRNQGSKKDKDRLRSLIRNLRQQAERARKGETHGRRGRGQQN